MKGPDMKLLPLFLLAMTPLFNARAVQNSDASSEKKPEVQLRLDFPELKNALKGFDGSFVLESWSWGITAEGGRMHSQSFHFVVYSSVGSSFLLERQIQRKAFSKATLHLETPEGTTQVFELRDVKVSSFQTGASAHSDFGPTEQVSLDFGGLKVTTSNKEVSKTVVLR